jgi:hypothetical protein
MAFSNTAKNTALDAVGTAAAWISMHTADPGTTGASEITGGAYARQQTAWQGAAGGQKAGQPVTINIPAGTTVTHWGVWTASGQGTFFEGNVLPSSEYYGSAGTIVFTPTLTASG